VSARSLLAVAAAGLTLAGCGYKGQLRLPEKPGEVTIRQGGAAAKPSAPAPEGQAIPPKAPPEAATPEAAPAELTPPGAATRTGGPGD
jgi:predicted small lipoprotein YifL